MKVGDKVRRINGRNEDSNGVTFEVGETGTVIAIGDYADVKKENGEIMRGNPLDNLEVIAEESPAESPKIKDSGNRREFETGAVRDIQEGKGRCDLLPLDLLSEWVGDVMKYIANFTNDGNPKHLRDAMQSFGDRYYNKSIPDMLLDVSKHFEEGCKKYGENNWKKGIPTHCYIDSAVRHFLKFKRGDTDEPHQRAFVWNILCCIWTCKNKPELNDYAKEIIDENVSGYEK